MSAVGLPGGLAASALGLGQQNGNGDVGAEFGDELGDDLVGGELANGGRPVCQLSASSVFFVGAHRATVHGSAGKAITSHYEQAARAAKVAALMAHVPAGNGNEAARLASFTKQMRAVFARGAGVRVPSETTWTALCEAVRVRAQGRRAA